MNQSSFKVPKLTSSEVTDAVYSCSLIMEKGIYDDFDVDRNMLKRNVASYIYSLFIMMFIACYPSIDEDCKKAVPSGLVIYCRSLLEDNPNREMMFHEIHEDMFIYCNVAWHKASAKGKYKDSSNLNKASNYSIWKAISPVAPLNLCHPGLMPFVFIDFLFNPKVKLNYYESSPFRHKIKCRSNSSHMTTSPELTLYNHCVDPLLYLRQKGFIPG